MSKGFAMVWWHDGVSGGGWTAMTLIMVAVWALVIYAVVALFRGDPGSGSSGSPAGRGPLQILDERFARGYIDVEEYRARRDALGAAEQLVTRETQRRDES